MILNPSNPYDDAQKDISELDNRIAALDFDLNTLDQALIDLKNDILGARAKVDICYNNAENTPTFTIGNMSVGLIPRSSNSGGLAFELAPIEIKPEPFIEISNLNDLPNEEFVAKAQDAVIAALSELLNPVRFHKLVMDKIIEIE
nr:MAG TPA: hypothetical protein [Caudoviricetes sp.]